MYTLGINAAFHDSAACLVQDGQVLAAAEEERFSRIKHGKRPLPFTTWELPYAAIDYCLGEAGIRLCDVDHVAYSYDPASLPLASGTELSGERISLPLEPSASGGLSDNGASPWDPLFLAYIVNAPRQLVGGAPHHLQARFAGAALQGQFHWHFVEHHLAHEASAFLAAPFAAVDQDEADCAVLTLDGRGERATTTLATWHGDVLTRLREIYYPHSLGLLYERLTSHLGFLHASDEYKVMALASYGKPRHLDIFRDLLVWDGAGGYTLRPLLPEIHFGPPRMRGEALTARHLDLAASLQQALQETALYLARWLRETSGERRLAMAGGVALNCVMNASIRDGGLFDQVWVQPAAGDAGTALGAALWIDRCQRAGTSQTGKRWHMEHTYLGPAYQDDEIEAALAWAKLPYRRLSQVADETAALLAEDRIVGWFQGRMEFGPRALGARSILASPINPAMQARLNALKDREDFRPVAPAVTEEVAGQWFRRGGKAAGQPAADSPFMLFVFDVPPEQAMRIPAAVHVDGSARVQTVSGRSNPRFHQLLHAFAQRTGVPVLINTSFNVRGEPIVCTPRDAINAFYATPLDALVIGDFLLEKRA